MEATSLIIGLIIGLLLGTILLFIIIKANYISKKEVEQLKQDLVLKNFENQNFAHSIEGFKQQLQQEKQNLNKVIEEKNLQQNSIAKSLAENNSLYQQLDDLKFNLKSKTETYEALNKEHFTLFTKNAELSALNNSLQNALTNQKTEIESLQNQSKLYFEKIATQILEEKSEKFTNLNQQQLKSILEPFEKNIHDLKKTVNETYDKEAKERFSLGEKVKELQSLNQQISNDAKKLTKALKGESKTQGNWGEMILENILEKSGLVKNREYFLEHELKNEDNKALHSEFSGKKMRPDAVIKYPDQRNVIIDSKVSLTAFVEMTDEEDIDLFKIKQQQHLQSVKNHINELSQKAYDDYNKSLDFVMLFIPSEPAYIAALQGDAQLWNYAYDKRILLLSPTNLITSLKLIEDLWKRDHQNKNAMEIADRGAKLYDKFVGFVDNLEKIGKNIEAAHVSYQDAYKQLYVGKDNLVKQTEKLKHLGIKNKKNLPQSLIDESESLIND